MYALLTLSVALAMWGLVVILVYGCDVPGSAHELRVRASEFAPCQDRGERIARRAAWPAYILFTAAAMPTHSTALFSPWRPTCL